MKGKYILLLLVMGEHLFIIKMLLFSVALQFYSQVVESCLELWSCASWIAGEHASTHLSIPATFKRCILHSLFHYTIKVIGLNSPLKLHLCSLPLTSWMWWCFCGCCYCGIWDAKKHCLHVTKLRQRNVKSPLATSDPLLHSRVFNSGLLNIWLMPLHPNYSFCLHCD